MCMFVDVCVHSQEFNCHINTIVSLVKSANNSIHEPVFLTLSHPAVPTPLISHR